MPNHLDFLRVLDGFTRENLGGCVQQGIDMHRIAHDSGLAAAWGDASAARWTGELVHDGYLTHGPRSLGDARPIPYGPLWSDSDLQRFGDYRVTWQGREEADRMRRLERASRSDAAVGEHLPKLVQPWMTDAQKHAICEPLRTLRVSLDDGRHVAAIGAAKDLAEAACKIAIERHGSPAPRNTSLPTLFKLATATPPTDEPADGAIGKSLAATVQRLAELRNSTGAGHGHASSSVISARHARLAASAASAVADFVLS